jgi:hypothetical protein
VDFNHFKVQLKFHSIGKFETCLVIRIEDLTVNIVKFDLMGVRPPLSPLLRASFRKEEGREEMIKLFKSCLLASQFKILKGSLDKRMRGDESRHNNLYTPI